MPPAIIAGGIAAVGTIGGAIIGSSAQRSAANSANAAQQQATQSQLQLGRENMAQQRDIYNANFGLLSPFVSRGNVAGENINALLGLPNVPAITSPLAGAPSGSTGGGASAYSGPSLQEIQAMQHDGIPGNYRAALNAYNAANHNPAPATAQATGTPAPATPAAPAATPISAMDAYNNFANSAGIKASMQGLQQNYAAKGLLQSGAAMKGLQQNAQQNFFLPYLGLLNGQQNVGAQAGSAVAGVGSNFGTTAGNIYGGMANAIQGGADSASAAAVARGQAGMTLANGIASGLGQFGSSFFPRGY